MHVCAHEYMAVESLERVLNSLEPDLSTVVSCPTLMLGIEFRYSSRVVYSLNH